MLKELLSTVNLSLIWCITYSTGASPYQLQAIVKDVIPISNKATLDEWALPTVISWKFYLVLPDFSLLLLLLLCLGASLLITCIGCKLLYLICLLHTLFSNSTFFFLSI